MKKSGICVIGAFDYENMSTGGQPVKSRELISLLEELYSDKKIYIVETSNWKKNPFLLLYKVLKGMHNSDCAIMLPAQNGVSVFSRILILFKRNRNLYYDVIGGWLPQKIRDDKCLCKLLRYFNGIWVETDNMRNELEKLGLKNVTTIPNFKSIEPVSVDDIKFSKTIPFKLCTFSRVMKEKGIEEALMAVKNINQKFGKVVFELDIYGQIDADYSKSFELLKKQFPSYIRYVGVVNPNESVRNLISYDSVLFPTYYEGEGLAGTLIDALMSGVPVIATDWHYNSEVINSSNGFLISTDDIVQELEKVLISIYDNPKIIIDKKKKCIIDSKKYSREYAFSLIENELNKNSD